MRLLRFGFSHPRDGLDEFLFLKEQKQQLILDLEMKHLS